MIPFNVFITGASSVIGEFLAYEYSKQKATIGITARRIGILEKIAKKCTELGGKIFSFSIIHSKSTNSPWGLSLVFTGRKIVVSSSINWKKSLSVETIIFISFSSILSNSILSPFLYRSADSCLCFLPGSQIALQPLKSFDHLMKIPQTFECVKLDKKRGNIVLSRRSILERIRDKDKDKIISKIKEGSIIQGTVKNLTEWGVFIDLNGVDALLHITDISWSRINKPSELLSLGQSVKVKII